MNAGFKRLKELATREWKALPDNLLVAFTILVFIGIFHSFEQQTILNKYLSLAVMVCVGFAFYSYRWDPKQNENFLKWAMISLFVVACAQFIHALTTNLDILTLLYFIWMLILSNRARYFLANPPPPRFPPRNEQK